MDLQRPASIDVPPEKLARFALRVMQHYAQEHDMALLSVWELFHEYGLIQEKLIDGYRPLNTQGLSYINVLIDDFLEERGYYTEGEERHRQLTVETFCQPYQMNDKAKQRRILRAKEADGEFIAYIADNEQCSLEDALKYFIVYPEYQDMIDEWVDSTPKNDIFELLVERYQHAREEE